MSTHGETPLSRVSGWGGAHAETMAKSWITTPEQVVGMAATPGGVAAIAKELGVSEESMHRLIDAARAALPPSVAAALSQPVDVSRFGLGALPPVAEARPRHRGGKDHSS